MSQHLRPLVCPSSRAELATQVIGVIQTTKVGRPRVAFTAGVVPFSDELRAATAAVPVGEVLRLAGACAEHACAHFVDEHCSLGERAAAELPAVVQRLPRCAIRRDCRWYAEQGGAICRRCPAIVSSQTSESEELAAVAQPPQQR